MTHPPPGPEAPMSYGEARTFLAQNTTQRRRALDELVEAHQQANDAERDYRIAQAKAWATVEGKSSDERKARVDAQCAGDRHARDVAVSRIKTTQAKIERLKDEAMTTMSMAGWAKLIDPAGSVGG